MTIEELIVALQAMQAQLGPNAQVLCQSAGCCMHGHEIDRIEPGREYHDRVRTEDEVGCVVIRV